MAWFPCSPRNSQEFSRTTVWKHQFFSAQSSLRSNSRQQIFYFFLTIRQKKTSFEIKINSIRECLLTVTSRRVDKLTLQKSLHLRRTNPLLLFSEGHTPERSVWVSLITRQAGLVFWVVLNHCTILVYGGYEFLGQKSVLLRTAFPIQVVNHVWKYFLS